MNPSFTSKAETTRRMTLSGCWTGRASVCRISPYVEEERVLRRLYGTSVPAISLAAASFRVASVFDTSQGAVTTCWIQRSEQQWRCGPFFSKEKDHLSRGLFLISLY